MAKQQPQQQQQIPFGDDNQRSKATTKEARQQPKKQGN
jgi:hypothetical protein